MNCTEFKINIDAYIDEELPIDESLEFLRHLQFCWVCCLDLMSFEKCKELICMFCKDINPPVSLHEKIFEKDSFHNFQNIHSDVSETRD